MVILFVILIILCCVALGFVVLVQNPKGGGLAANIGGIGNQFMGVRQTTDVLEKGTWIFAAIVALLCLVSGLFLTNTTGSRDSLLDKVNTRPTTTNTLPSATPPAGNIPQQQPVNPQQPAPTPNTPK